MSNHQETCLCRQCMWEEVREDVLARQDWDLQMSQELGFKATKNSWDITNAELMEEHRRTKSNSSN